MSHWFDRMWGSRKAPSSPKRPAKNVTPASRKASNAGNVHSPHDPQAARAIAAAQARRRQWERYIDARRHKLETLAQTYPSVATYRATLRSLLKDPAAEWTGPRDCNVDLADLCRELGFAAIPNTYDRFLLLEVASDFIRSLAKRRHLSESAVLDDPVPLPLGGRVGGPVELDRVASVLGLRDVHFLSTHPVDTE